MKKEILTGRSLAIVAINPDSADVGMADLMLTIKGQQGAGFLENDTMVVLKNNTELIMLKPLVGNEQGMSVALDAKKFRNDALFKIKAVIVDEKGEILKEGNEVLFPVGTPKPSISEIFPAKITDDTDDTPAIIRITGLNFLPSARLLINDTCLEKPKQWINEADIEYEIPKRYRKNGKKIKLQIVNMGTNPKASNEKKVEVIGPDDWSANQTLSPEAEKVIRTAEEEIAKEKRKRMYWQFGGIGTIVTLISIIMGIYGPCNKPQDPIQEPKAIEQPPPKEKSRGEIKGIIHIPNDLFIRDSVKIVFHSADDNVTIQPAGCRWGFYHVTNIHVEQIGEDGSILSSKIYSPDVEEMDLPRNGTVILRPAGAVSPGRPVTIFVKRHS